MHGFNHSSSSRRKHHSLHKTRHQVHPSSTSSPHVDGAQTPPAMVPIYTPPGTSAPLVSITPRETPAPALMVTPSETRAPAAMALHRNEHPGPFHYGP